METRINDFLNVLSCARDDQQIKQICESEIASLKHIYKLGTVRVYLAKYRKKLQAISKDHKAVSHMILSYEDNETIEIDLDKTLEQYLDNNIDIFNHIKMIQKAIDLIRSENYLDIILGLALLTGRRIIELAKIGGFDFIASNKLLFSGQAKSGLSEKPPYGIFCLSDAFEIVKNFDRMRESIEYKEFSNKANSKVISSLNRGLSRRLIGFKEFTNHEPLKVHDLRGIYAAVCYQRYGKGKSLIYFNGINLGHVRKGDFHDDKRNLKSSVHYEKYQIIS